MMKRILIALTILLCLGSLAAQGKTRYKALTFDNPGTKRVLKSGEGNYFYFRSLPEKAMKLNTTGISKVEIRSFSTETEKKPEIVVIIGKNRSPRAMQPKETINSYQVYQPVIIDIPTGTSQIEILCYSRAVYLRAFNILPPKPPKPTKLKNLVLKAHGGAVSLMHNGSSSDYYSLMPPQPLKFTLNNQRNAVVYVRPRLLDRSTPQLEVYKDGKLIQTVDFTIKRTTKYHAQGIANLGIAKKIELPPNDGTSNYELKSISDHLFIVKPVLLKSP